jgi:hypothetical protein
MREEVLRRRSMKRTFLVLTLALLVSMSLSVGAAKASHSNGAGPNKDLLIGTGKDFSDGALDSYFHINAQSGPEGENPGGHFTVRTTFGTFDPIPVAIKGEVACLAVRDNRSVVVGLGEDKQVDDLGPFWLFVLFIDDNGEGQEPNDTFTYTLIGQPNPIPVPACNRNDLLDSLDEVHPFNVIEQGNFIVHDAMP